ncbi:riboflavin biosynthesis protein RibD [Camelimonas fluminis]|nr:riboflavin biosynthesis protein RibD [Camelimonas fluminis]
MGQAARGKGQGMADSLALDRRFMRDALAMGRRNLGLAWPNPAVGAVLVDPRNHAILGRGATQPGGRPHAEVVALGRAGAAARGATLYVTLEPCSHVGRTGPCADAIIAAGVARVVSAIEDPNPLVAGLGHGRLREAGVEVLIGVGAEQARRDHIGHFTRVRDGRPAVLLKLAQTCDGVAGRRQGPRLMITGQETRARVHLMRARADVILAGVNTILADDPDLTVRLPGMEAMSPVRVVLDSMLRTPPAARIVQDAGRVPTWIIAAEHAPVAPEIALARAGVEVMRVGSDADGRPHLAMALQLLGTRGVTRVFCEGGPALAEALAAARLVEEVALFTGPSHFDGPPDQGVAAMGPHLRTALDAMCVVETGTVGDDALQIFERVN